jgi:hypothetical protein
MVLIKEEVFSEEETPKINDETNSQTEVSEATENSENSNPTDYEEQRIKNIERNKEKMKEIMGEKETEKKKKRSKKTESTEKRKSKRISGESIDEEDSDDDSEEGDENRQDKVTFQRRPKKPTGKRKREPVTTGPNVMRKVSGKIYDSVNGKTCHQVLVKTL